MLFIIKLHVVKVWVMTVEQKQEILSKAKSFFSDKIIRNHLAKIKEMGKIENFTPNPFLQRYLAKVVFGTDSAENIAKVLIYPRVLGTSINTIFGTHMQTFCTSVLGGFASTTAGIDIEFIDQIDGRRKYCQIKAGPNTINKDDIKTITDHFRDIRNLARTNRLEHFNPDIDCVVGVLYGTEDNLSAMYHKIQETNPVYCGQDFWTRLTGDQNFYQELIDCMSECVDALEDNDVVSEVIHELAEKV